MGKIFISFGMAALLSVSSVAVAQAADRDFCRNYTDAALRQVHVALDVPRCVRRIDTASARWSTDPEVHFRWCRGVTGYDAAAERDARTRILDHCRF